MDEPDEVYMRGLIRATDAVENLLFLMGFVLKRPQAEGIAVTVINAFTAEQRKARP